MEGVCYLIMWGKSIRYLILGEGGMSFNYGGMYLSSNYMGRDNQLFSYWGGNITHLIMG